MAPNKPTIQEMLAADRLDRIQADPEEALEILEHAETHLDSARKIIEHDPAGAYQLLYDAARKATTADMLAQGYRAKDRQGAHAAVVSYAENTLTSKEAAEAVANFDRMRRSRNRTEYGSVSLSTKQVKADLEHANTIVAAVRGRLGTQGHE